MMKMNLPAVVTTTLYIYHGCSTWKTFWEENFTGEEKFTLDEFSAANMKHREIKGSHKYVTLDISLKLRNLYKMRIKSLEPKDNLGRSGKGLITSLGIKAKAIPTK